MTVTFSFDRMNLPFRTDFCLGGVHCLLSTNSHSVLQQAVPWQSSPADSAAATFHMEIIEDSSLDPGQKKITHFRGMRHLVFAMIEPGSFVTYDLLRREVRGVLSSEAARDASFWKAKFLPITLGVLGTTLGVAPLHCACLVRNSDGLLITGVSGSGKSTLTAALASRGFTVVSDDWTYLSQKNESLMAEGLWAPIKLLPDTSRFFPELQKSIPRKTLNGEIAYEIEPGRFRASAAISSCEPKLTIFLERTTLPGTRFLPSQPEDVRHYFESNAERLPEELSSAKSSRSEIINRLSECPSWLLRTGDDPHKTAEAIEQFLSEANYGV